MKAKETGVPLPGAAAMNETRIKLLEDLGFVWTLRGSREDHMNLRQFHLQHTDDGKEEDLHLNAVKTNAPVKAP